MAETFKTVSPIDGSTVIELPFATPAELDDALTRGTRAFREWRKLSLDKRAEHVTRFVEAVMRHRDTLAAELTEQMGRPIRYSAGELNGFEERARAMIDVAASALSDVTPKEKEGFTRFVRREPLGLVLVLAPWNYPWLTAVNAIVPALMAGNSVVLKHSDQTPLVADRLAAAAKEAELPDGVFQRVHASHAQVADAVRDERVAFVAFTGSVDGGRAIVSAAASRFVGVGLELGGKDPGYVAADARVPHAIETLVDGAFFNSGQSCCGIERIYVHESRFDEFVEGAVALTQQYVVGDPRDQLTTLGPVVRERNARAIQAQVDAAIQSGARALIDPASFGTLSLPTLPPQILVNVTHEMDVMREETFGPVVGVMKVTSDAEAIEKMNDSRYGLTAAVFTSDLDRAKRIAVELETGTVFMNRCDYLDPELAWVGVKDSGRGCTLSSVGYEHLTRPKSFHFRH